MTKKQKLILQIIVSLAILIISWFIINIIDNSCQIGFKILAAIITWVIISMGDRIDYGFSDKNVKKAKIKYGLIINMNFKNPQTDKTFLL